MATIFVFNMQNLDIIAICKKKLNNLSKLISMLIRSSCSFLEGAARVVNYNGLYIYLQYIFHHNNFIVSSAVISVLWFDCLFLCYICPVWLTFYRLFNISKMFFLWSWMDGTKLVQYSYSLQDHSSSCGMLHVKFCGIHS